MSSKKTFELNLTGKYNDTHKYFYNPCVTESIEGKNVSTHLAGHISNELKKFEGKQVKMTVTVSVEEI